MLVILGKYLSSLYGSFDGSDDGKLEGLLLGGSLGSTDGRELGSDEVIKLGYNYGKELVTILGNVYRITLGIDIGIELGSLDVSFDGSNGGKFEGLLIEDSLGYTDGKLISSDEGINLEYTDDKMLGNILGNVHGITLAIDIGTELVSLYVLFDGLMMARLRSYYFDTHRHIMMVK